ncbi:concentrative nucleoside transporter, CNT family [Malonomonas rubra DSM 5091]|uniref:Concentrative nucleoside transporter, CNT family n=1 Tax=Malonomonas rubra DSM 5091 TaxID=1122189 RepID=A0A1M6LES9_MALRU|nr:nucleoside transporter C-terminal domain-containing protein [Malonomonas rubra]SHJ69666.1 concentrative nucleoside transporter, CNT family [Malonomonas rubra DSM 5091]
MAYRGVLGVLLLLLLAWLASEQRRKVNWRLVVTGVVLQFLVAALLLKFPPIKDLFLLLNTLTLALEKATTEGTSMVFGFLGGGNLPFAETAPGASFVFAFRALPIILVVSALSSLLFYWRILPLLVKGCSLLLEKSLQVGGAVGISAAANIFVGMVEAPLLVRPYLKKMSRGELFALMVCGMSTIAGTVLVLYASILRETLPDSLGHILTASIISAPAALVIAGVMVPHVGEATVGREMERSEATGAMDAITRGTADGIKLLLNVIAMLIVLLAMVSFCNQLLGLLPDVAGEPLTLQRVLGVVAAPVVWLLGVPWDEAFVAGSLLGTKTILNEFVAYLQLVATPVEQLGERSRLIMVYALCGFANFGSLGIMIGGLGAMAPDRRDEIISLGMKSIVAGVFATCMTGAVVGLIY